MQSVYEGLQMPMDQALTVESRYFAHVLQTPEAASMIRSLFVSMQELNKGARRPEGVSDRSVKKLGVLGAGFMGAGIAYVSAKAGIEVVLIDRDQAAADKGKAHSDELMSKAIKRGRASEADKEKLLSLITPTTDYAQLAGCDLVIEAVFEDREIKRKVTEQAEAAMGDGAIYASNTSTLPITSLAQASSRPKDFIGIHFFSPVDKMMLVEVIMGEETGDEALATALDFVRAIRKTPIVVNDSRGFYTSRVVMTYIREGLLMLADGVPAAMVETCGKMAGMPVGPLSLGDEVALDLAWKIVSATRKDLGEAYKPSPLDAILEEMVVKRERFGRKNAKGFYDYQGRDKALWPGIPEVVGEPKPAESFDVTELKQRLLVMQALETARIFEEGCLSDVREADVGSILGFGFAPYSGGTLSYIDGMGTRAFVELCERFTQAHGERFAPNALLIDMAKTKPEKAFKAMTSWGHGPGAHKFDNTQPGHAFLGYGRRVMAQNDAAALHRLYEALQIFLGLFDDLLGKRPLRNIGQCPVRILGEACAGVCIGESGAKGIADDDFLQDTAFRSEAQSRNNRTAGDSGSFSLSLRRGGEGRRHVARRVADAGRFKSSKRHHLGCAGTGRRLVRRRVPTSIT